MQARYLSKEFKKLNRNFWFAPMDSYLRAFEVAIWKTIKFKKPTLDIGCGDGRIDTLLFAGKSIEVGLDPSTEAIDFAKDNPLYKKVVVARAEKIPFNDGCFNTVILNSTFEHIKGDRRAVSEISRVLKKGGTLIFTTTTKDLKDELRALFSDNNKFKEFNKRVAHFHYRTFDEWVKTLSKNKLVVTKHFTYFTKKDLRSWLILFRIFTYKFRGRELWSYLKDSRFSKYLPGKLISDIQYHILNPMFDRSGGATGLWQYIQAKKTK